MGWSCAPPRPLALPGPGEWGLLLGRNSQETLRGDHGLLYPDTRPPPPAILSFLSAFTYLVNVLE